MKRPKGFTLIELLVVIIIVGILASVAIPMMQANRQRAMLSEAKAALGVLRSAVRLYQVEHEATNPSSGEFKTPGYTIPGVIGSDLDGTFFSKETYAFRDFGGQNYQVMCFIKHWNYPNSAPKASYVNSAFSNEVHIQLDQDGNFSRHDYTSPP